MVYARRTCINPMCGKTFRPRREKDRLLLDYCSKECVQSSEAPSQVRAPMARQCSCGSVFQIPKRNPAEPHCAHCRKQAEANMLRGLQPPLVQAVVDLETFGLDLGFGTILVSSGVTFGIGTPRKWTYAARDFAPWQAGRRSDYSELLIATLDELSKVDVIIAHNGREFDVKILNTGALRYGYPHIIGKKLLDPVQILRQNYRIGGNSLANAAAFLELDEQKMPVPMQVWRGALMDDNQDDWEWLIERCESDVRVLAKVAARVAPSAGDINNRGSAAR